MLVKRFGSTVQAVVPRFQARALTEIAFQREGPSWPAEEFDAAHERLEVRTLTAEGTSLVKDEAEHAVLDGLLERLEAVEREAGDGAVLLVENQPGTDHPKTRDRTENVVVDGEARARFTYTIDPPLRVAIYRAAPPTPRS